MSMRLRKLERSVSTLHQGISTQFDSVRDVLRKGASSPVPPPYHVGPPSQSASRTPSIGSSTISVMQPVFTHTDSFPALHTQGVSLMTLNTIKLGEDDFTFDRTSVPDPPAIHFSENLTQLFAHWHCSDLLKINGRGIPIKYWSLIYQSKHGDKVGAWAKLRGPWGIYKVCANVNSLHTHLLTSCRLVSSRGA